MTDLVTSFRRHRAHQPQPDAMSRFEWLFDHARRDLALTRLLEADLDARTIAADLGVELVAPDASYGVWAAAGGTIHAVFDSCGKARLHGRQAWAGGAALVDRALVLVRSADRSDLFDVEVRRDEVDLSNWRTDTLRETATGSVDFDGAPARRLGGGEHYLGRAGFWHGATGVAACWAGAAAGLVDAHVDRWQRHDPHALGQLGAAVAEASSARRSVLSAAAEIVANPGESSSAAEVRAREVRYVLDATCRRIVDHLSVGAGPFPLAMDDAVSRRTAELLLTIRQCHGLREVEPVGAIVSSTRSADHRSDVRVPSGR